MTSSLRSVLFTVEGWLSWLARPLRLGLGYLWAAALLMFGLWLWNQHGEVVTSLMGWAPTNDSRAWGQIVRSLSIFAMSGAQFVFLFLVADELFPNTPLLFSEFLEFFFATVALGALVWTLWIFSQNVVQ